MIKKTLLSFFAVIMMISNLYAIQLQECEVRGVKPSDKISTLEFNPATTIIDDKAGISLTSMTLKYYYSFSKMFSIGTELPFARFESPEQSRNGLGDMLLSASAVKRFGRVAFGTTMEFTLPTASYDELGSGKWQFSPAAYGEFQIIDQVFLAVGYKHYVSFAGPDSREDINLGRVRAILAYLSDYNVWVLVDPKYYIDYNNDNAGEFILETEAGIMLYEQLAMYIKPGWHVGGNRNTMDWSISFGVKLLSI